MSQLIRIQAVTPREGFVVRVEFTDGTIREIDLEPYLDGPVFQALREDPEMFRLVKVDPRMRTLIWPNGADLDPDVLYHGFPPARMESDFDARVA